MAGQPTFRRAKRFTYLHTDYTSIFDGAHTVHVKTNLTASVEGNFKSKADKHHFTSRASVDGNLAISGKITAAENVIRSHKRTVGYAELTASGRIDPQSVIIYRASAGDSIYNVVANIVTPFTQASLMGTGLNGVTRTHFSVGDVSATGGFKTTTHTATDAGWHWTLDGTNTGASVGAYLKTIYATPLVKTYTTAATVSANFRASECMLGSLNAGQIDFYVDVMSRS